MLIAFSEVGRQAIYADQNWQYGDYYENGKRPDAGLAVARMVGHITYLSEESMHKKFGRRLQGRERFGYEFETEFQIESYLRYKGQAFTQRFDANSYLFITKALDYFDLSRSPQQPEGTANSLAAAFTDAEPVKFLVVSFTSDWLYPSYHSRELVSALTAAGADVTYLDIQSTWGHDAFLLEVETMTRLLSSFVDRVARRRRRDDRQATCCGCATPHIGQRRRIVGELMEHLGRHGSFAEDQTMEFSMSCCAPRRIELWDRLATCPTPFSKSSCSPCLRGDLQGGVTKQAR